MKKMPSCGNFLTEVMGSTPSLYQTDFFEKFASGGYKRGELVTFGLGRQMGKSMITRQMIDDLVGIGSKPDWKILPVEQAFSKTPFDWPKFCIPHYHWVSPEEVEAFGKANECQVLYRASYIFFETFEDAVLWKMSK
jgi:hypothetical protein